MIDGFIDGRNELLTHHTNTSAITDDGFLPASSIALVKTTTYLMGQGYLTTCESTAGVTAPARQLPTAHSRTLLGHSCFACALHR